MRCLTEEMIKREHRGPQLKSKGGETRGLVPFALELAIEMRDRDNNLYTQTVVAMMAALVDFYCLVSTPPYRADEAAVSCRRFLILHAILNKMTTRDRGSDLFWRIKPTFHMMQELAEYISPEHGSPREFWCYQDEDFVGWVASFGGSRGGANTCGAVGERVIQRYRAWIQAL